jgi:2-polyprenyl-6-hydroxyphenyl methylase/3-demethylubiquinone-9 3-methyltransferase
MRFQARFLDQTHVIAEAMSNVDPRELEKFSQLAHRWWDPSGELRPLHEINPLRLDFIDRMAGGLGGKRVLDVGCGGGILAESMAALGAQVTGIDLSEESLAVARLHLLESGLTVDYRLISTEDFARESPRRFDVVTCMELLEHVPDPQSIVTACAGLLKPDGHAFFATLNRNLKSYLFAVIGAEYVLKLLPRGTHDYARFIKPSELAAMCRNAGLAVCHLTGMTYNPLTRTYALGENSDVNYILHARNA